MRKGTVGGGEEVGTLYVGLTTTSQVFKYHLHRITLVPSIGRGVFFLPGKFTRSYGDVWRH